MLSLRQVNGGWLAQESDDLTPEAITFTKMSERAPEGSELSDSRFAWLCVKHVKSNAIVIAKVSSARTLAFLCSANSKENEIAGGSADACGLMVVGAQNNCMLGMGSGQPNRLESLRIAFRKAGEEAKGAALASDAFFPFGE